MSYQFCTDLKTARAATLQILVGVGGLVRIFSDAVPLNTSAADPAHLLVEMGLPDVFLTSAAGVTTIAGDWSGTAVLAGEASSFRLYKSDETCVLQGTVTEIDGLGLLTIDDLTIVVDQIVTASTFTLAG